MTVIAEDDHLTAGAWATCDSNDPTVHFKEPFSGEKCYHIRLISSALFLTHGVIWSELKEIFVFNAQGTQTVKTISEGDYSFKSLGQALQHTMKSEGVKFDMNTLKWLLEIHNPQNKHILLDDDLADLFGIKWRLQTYNLSKWFNYSPTTLSAVIFWVIMKTYTMESPRAFLDVSTLSGNPLIGWPIIRKYQPEEKYHITSMRIFAN